MAATPEQKNRSQNAIRAKDREIGPPPQQPSETEMREVDGEEISLAEIRRRCDESLRFFLEYCFPAAFRLSWSEDHLRVIGDIERTVILGLLKALAMPRGNGKTTIIIRAALWAILTKRRRFCSVVAATDAKARKLLKSMKTIILHNKRLAELYGPELHAVRSLHNESRKAAQQTCNGELTGVEWTVDQICFGYASETVLMGAAISVCGITGNIRGQEITLPSGDVIRPDLGLVDDPQTKSSAKSKAQCDERHETMMGDVLGMAGPDEDFAAFCTCTVIYEDDLADRLLSYELSPDWNGDKCQMIYAWPDNETIWEEYRTVRLNELKDGGDGTIANQFVSDNFEEMHRGSRVAWEERRGGGKQEGRQCLSALQYAYNLRFRDEATFWAEYQNTPLATGEKAPFELRVDDIAEKVTSVARGKVPEECEKLVAHIDVQGKALYFSVMAWTIGGRGYVIEYGAWPDQKRIRWTKRDIRKTLADVTGEPGENEACYAGLEQLTDKLLGKTYQRTDGAKMTIDRVGVDARDGNRTRVIRRFSRETKWIGKVMPTFGQYVGSKSQPWHKWVIKPGESAGVHCRLQPPPKNTRGVRELLIDVNWWKSFAAERLLAGKGAKATILLFKAKPHKHRMFAEHCCSETNKITTAKSGMKLIEWEQPGSGTENEFWDNLVANCCLASLEGVQVHVERKAPVTKKNTKKRRKVAPLAC